MIGRISGGDGFVARNAAGVCAVAAAMIVEYLWAVELRRGSCAAGFPIPFARATGASSADDYVMPHILLVDLVLVAAVLLPGFMLIRRWLPGGARAVMGVFGLWAGLLGLLFWVVFLLAAARPVWSVPDPKLGSCEAIPIVYVPRSPDAERVTGARP